jgi:hypothetical protein
METNLNQILDSTEAIQKEMLKFINELYSDEKFLERQHRKTDMYNSAKDVFFMMKISELQNQIKELKAALIDIKYNLSPEE